MEPVSQTNKSLDFIFLVVDDAKQETFNTIAQFVGDLVCNSRSSSTILFRNIVNSSD
jgi:hypothetical protein